VKPLSFFITLSPPLESHFTTYLTIDITNHAK
jgi:hypothetical protein